MSRGTAPILNRTLVDLLDTHPLRGPLPQLVRFVEQVLVPRRAVVGVALLSDLSGPGLELVIVLEDDTARGPSAIRWRANRDSDAEMDLGMRWWSFSRIGRQSWPEGVKHALSHGLLLWDPHDLLCEFLETRLWYPDALRRHRLLDNCFRLEELLRGGGLADWLYRGELLQAHHMLSTALDRLIDHLFDFNQVWRPSLIARFPAVQQLEWLPEHFETRLEAAMRTGDLRVDALLERLAAMSSLFESIQGTVEAEPWWPERPHQQWRANLEGA